MRKNLWRAVVGVVLFSAFGGMAYQAGEKKPVCDVPVAKASATSAVTPESAATVDRDTLVRALAERELELQALRNKVQANDDSSFYAEAERLGVVDAVKASGLPERQQRRIAVAIVREAKTYGVHPLLVVAVIRTESSFNNYAVSHVGAMGLMQVMPDTGKWLVDRRGGKLGRSTNLFDSELNIELGTSYLAELIQMFGSEDKALVAYNAGPGNAKKILKSKEARKKFMAGYPKKVLTDFARLKKKAETRMAEQDKSPVPNGRG